MQNCSAGNIAIRLRKPRLALLGLLGSVVCFEVGSAANAQDPPPQISRAELLKTVDRKILLGKHHIDVSRLAQMQLRVLLSIDEISSSAPQPGEMISVSYTVTNLTLQEADGVVTGQFQGGDLVNLDGSKPSNIHLPPGKSLTSALKTRSGVLVGTQPLRIGYRDRVTCHNLTDPHSGKPATVCTAAVTADATLELTVVDNADADLDGIPDSTEEELLARFRPYYRFSTHSGDEEASRPADPLWFVQRSELYDHKTETDSNPIFTKAQLTDDARRIFLATSIGSSRTDVSPHKSGYYLNLANEFRPGESDWAKIHDEATGLFGHVSPLREEQTNPSAITAFKIEYWQFYAFNPVPGQIDCYAISDAHEGDWEGLELVVEADKRTIRSVRHYVHSASVLFELSKAKGPAVDFGNGFVEFRGPNEQRSYIDLYAKLPSGIDQAQNNLLRFFCDNEECTHPVAYIEYGGHAEWPTEFWAWPGVLNHDGNSKHAYLVKTPPNLGEIGHPNKNCLSCILVVGFNGHWGACGNDPPEGPPLHGSWGRP